MRTISKDITEFGLQNIVKSGFRGNILNLKLFQRKRENLNRAEIIVRTMREARQLVDSLEKNQIFPKLSPMIVQEDGSDTSESPEDSPPPRPQPKTKPKSVGAPVLDPLQQEETDEVFTFNKPFLSENREMLARAREQEKPTRVERAHCTVSRLWT